MNKFHRVLFFLAFVFSFERKAQHVYRELRWCFVFVRVLFLAQTDPQRKILTRYHFVSFCVSFCVTHLLQLVVSVLLFALLFFSFHLPCGGSLDNTSLHVISSLWSKIPGMQIKWYFRLSIYIYIEISFFFFALDSVWEIPVLGSCFSTVICMLFRSDDDFDILLFLFPRLLVS